jgi:hypothetical protein
MRPSFERLRGLRRNELGKIVCTIKGGVGQSGSGIRSFNILWSVPLLGNCRLLAITLNSAKLHITSGNQNPYGRYLANLFSLHYVVTP